MNPLRWLRETLDIIDARKFGRIYGGSTYSGKPMTWDAALQLSTVWACTRLRSKTIGTLPFQVFKPGPGGAPIEDKEHTLYKIIHLKPNAEFTAARLWQSSIASLDLWGNVVLEKMEGTQKKIVALNWINPAAIVPHIRRSEQDGTLLYPFYDPIRKERRELREHEVVHVRGFSLGGIVGVSAIQFGRNSLGVARDADEVAGRWFSQGMRPSGWFHTPRGFTDPQREDFRKNVAEPMMGVEATGGFGLLEHDIKWNQVAMNPDDSQLLETRKFSVEELCRWFDTPPIMVGHASEGQTMWGSGVEQLILQWLISTVAPECIGIEQQLMLSLLRPEEIAAGVFIRINIDALMRSTAEARMKYLTDGFRGSMITANEGRRKLNYPDQEGGDVLFAQQQMRPLSMLITPAPIPAPGQPPTPAPGKPPANERKVAA